MSSFLSNNILKKNLFSTDYRRKYDKPGYLSRIFRDQFGISMMEYIRLRKIQMVKINFIFTTHNTSDVAFMLGFNESSYLQKVFQKVEGISIQEFKTDYNNQYPAIVHILCYCYFFILGWKISAAR